MCTKTAVVGCKDISFDRASVVFPCVEHTWSNFHGEKLAEIMMQLSSV